MVDGVKSIVNFEITFIRTPKLVSTFMGFNLGFLGRIRLIEAKPIFIGARTHFYLNLRLWISSFSDKIGLKLGIVQKVGCIL